MPFFTTKEFAYQCEKTMALNRVEFTTTQKKIDPHSDSTYIEIGNGYAVFNGVDSPLSRATALGFEKEFTKDYVLEIEKFYNENNSPVVVEVSQLANMELTYFLIERGFRIHEYTNALGLKLEPYREYGKEFLYQTRIVNENELNNFIDTTTEGFLEIANQSEIQKQNMQLLKESFDKLSEVFFYQPHTECFLTTDGENLVGAGGLYLNKNIALFLATTTLLDYRFKGIQSEIIRHRLNYASKKNIEIGLSVTYPGSISQHNLEKTGFQVLYGRVTFKKDKVI